MTTSWGRAPEASYRTSCVQPNSATPGGGAGGGSEGRSPWSPASHSLKRMGWGGASSRSSQYSSEEGKKSQSSKILLPPISSFFLWVHPSDLDHPLKQYINSFGNCHCLNCHITESLVSPGLSRKVKLIDDHIIPQIFSINALWVVGGTLH